MQVELSEYLQCELFHVLGAYDLAESRLAGLSEQLKRGPASTVGKGGDGSEGSENGFDALSEIADMSSEYNRELKWNRYASHPGAGPHSAANGGSQSSRPIREPLPRRLPLTAAERFEILSDDESSDRSRTPSWAFNKRWEPIPKFYGLVIATLESIDADNSFEDADLQKLRAQFATSIVAPRDPGAFRAGGEKADPSRIRRRKARYHERREEAINSIGPHRSPGARSEPSPRYKVETESDYRPQLEWIENNLEDGFHSAAMFVLRAQLEGHLSMHAVEVWRNLCLGGQAESITSYEADWLNRELDRSIALSTFAFCAGRIMPWIFAKDSTEREIVLSRPVRAWENMIPVRCIWVATQVSLLALHRRAYAHALKDDPISAYNDYHKLQKEIRDTERRVRLAPLHVEGALVFLAALNAEAHHHIGELYRSQHAHRPALDHFRAAAHGLEKLKSEDAGAEILGNSRWYVELQISYGKACYEMGRHKEALYWHLSAWESFLGLLSSETTTTAKTDAIEQARAWLDRVKYEPEIRKSDVNAQIGPVVEQLGRITMVGRLGALAAEILLRLGHLLFVLNIRPEHRFAGKGDEANRTAALAAACLVKAAECDPHSTLIGADLLKTALRQKRDDDKIAKEVLAALESIAPIDEQWPGGGGDFEKLARVAEYLVLRGQRLDRPGNGGGDGDRKIAQALMLDLFMSTDSTDVRKSQIHRFLMKERTKRACPATAGKSIEMICMRRYSSAFPLLPRPSAFRALGGGYFVRVQAGRPSKSGKSAPKPVGIVVDPGVDFVENLYRTGYALGDIDMIVVTHDHVDHLGGLDPLLSLLHVRTEILKKEPTAPAGTVTVLTSRSVARRYKATTLLQASGSSLNFRCFEDDGEPENQEEEKEEVELYSPEQAVKVDGTTHRFEILPMSSKACNPEEKRPGHRDLSDRPSFGICIRIDEAGPSVAITSDTPEPPRLAEGDQEPWMTTFKPALEADILVCHLGSVPLTELRRMDGYDPGDPKILHSEKPKAKRTIEDEAALKGIRDALQQANAPLLGQIEYSHWLRSHQGDQPPVPTADLVGKVDPAWLPPRDHNYLRGLLTWARAFRDKSSELLDPAASLEEGDGDRVGGRLFVVGELSEELGTMRVKLATRLNQYVFAPKRRKRKRRHHERRWPHSALTGDIGLHTCVSENGEGVRKVEVLCTTCNLDTDRAREERHHAASEIDEVCVKGENEGIFYNCREHHPTSRREDEAFLERLERFDIFGR